MGRSFQAASLLIGAGAAVVACNGIFGIDPGHPADDAGSDARGDSGGEGGAPDARSEDGGADAATVDGGLADAGLCVPVSLQDAGVLDPVGCRATDASNTCNAQAIPNGWVPPWTPPASPRAACTSAELDRYIAECFQTGNCAPFAAASPDCMKCIETPEGSAAYGAVVVPAREVFKWPNVAGCIALLEPCNEPCARLTREYQGCIDKACETSCQGLGNFAYQQCQTYADSDSCVCSAIRTAARDCQRNTLSGTGAARACGKLGNFDVDNARLVATVLCGGK